MKKFFRKYFYSPKHKRQLVFISFILLAIILILLFFSWFNNFIKDYDSEKMRPKDRLITKIAKISDIFFFPYFLMPSKLDEYSLVINKNDYRKLKENLPEPYSRVILQKTHKEAVPAVFKFNNQEYEVKVRYTGDLYPHWSNEKKSWHIKFNKEVFERKKEFDLVLPERRHLILAELNNYRAKKLNLTVREHKFVFLKVNGINQGVYLLTESWNKDFLEKNQKTPIGNLYGEKDNIWGDINSPGSNFLYKDSIYWKRHVKSEIENLKNGGEMGLLLEYLNNLDDELFYKEIKNLVDMDNFYRWQSNSMLIGDYHQDWWHNARFYFNPSKGKFEIFPVDVKKIVISDFIDLNYNPLTTRILLNPEFMYQRNKILWDYVSDADNLQDDLDFYDKIYKKGKVDFLKDREKFFSNIGFFITSRNYRNDIIQQFKNIKNLLSDCRVSILIDETEELVYGKKKINLSFTGYGYSSAFIKSIKGLDKSLMFYDSNKNQLLDKKDLEINSLDDINFHLLIQRHKPKAFPEGFLDKLEPKPTIYHFFLLVDENKLKDIKLADFEIVNAVTGEKIEPEIAVKEEIKQKPHFSIFQKSKDGKLILPAGNYQITQNIIIPSGFQVEIKPGAQLRFGKGISLCSYSPIRAVGLEELPIIFTSLDKKKQWGSVSVNQTFSQKSYFENVIVEYGEEAFVDGIYFTGALSGFYADIEIKNSVFRFNGGDDALNVKNANVLISTNDFYQNKADALDLDFSEGNVEKNNFKNNGNDAIDLGSSSVKIIENHVEGSGDKCLSIGEESFPEVIGNYFSGCQIGIAVKDSSSPQIIRNIISNNEVGIAVYTKKEIFPQKEFNLLENIFENNKKDRSYD